MSLRLVSLRHAGDDLVEAELESAPLGDRLVTTFEVDRGTDITVATPTPDVYAKAATSIEEVRRITQAVITFSLAAAPSEK